MGLLDVFNTEEGRLGLGLLSAAAPRSDGANFGQRLSEGVGSFDAWKKSNNQQKKLDAEFAEQMAIDAERQGGSLQKFAGLLQSGQPDAAYAMALQSRLPELRQIGTQGFSQMPQMAAQRQERQENRDWRTQEAQATRDARAQELHAKLADARTSQAERLTAQKEMREMQIQAQKEMKSMVGAISKAQPYFQPVQTAQGVMSFNARTGQMEPIKVGGAAVVGSNSDPKLQGDITGAKEGAKAGVEKGVELGKSNKRSDQLLSALDKAEALLKLGPTNSGVGAGVDFAGRMVGATSNSAKLASELETISGWMTTNVPRMEGPQSNYDVQNYQVMAAKVGDRTVPVPERLAAAKGLRELQTKYKAINNETIETPKPGAKSLVRTGTLNGRKVNQYSDGTTDYAD